jgi:hypothetical protein
MGFNDMALMDRILEAEKAPKARHKCDESGCRVFKPGNDPSGVPRSLRRKKDGIDRLIDSMPTHRLTANMKNNKKLR